MLHGAQRVLSQNCRKWRGCVCAESGGGMWFGDSPRPQVILTPPHPHEEVLIFRKYSFSQGEIGILSASLPHQ